MYLEHEIDPALRDVAVCTWQHSSVEASCSKVVPDACVDILWDGARLLLAGPDTGPVEVAMRAGTHILGLRFAPGAAGTLLGVPASAVRDARVPLQELWGDRALRLEETLQRTQEPRAALQQMEAALRAHVSTSAAVDPLASAVARALQPSLDFGSFAARGFARSRLQRDSLAGLQAQLAAAASLRAGEREACQLQPVAAAPLGAGEREARQLQLVAAAPLGAGEREAGQLQLVAAAPLGAGEREARQLQQAGASPLAAASERNARQSRQRQAGASPLAAASERARVGLTGSPVPSVAQLSAALGVSERQLLRRCDAAFGYGPKLLARVLRFQAFVRALREHSHIGLAELALELGYTDQAHLAHETAELAGQTPSQLRARWSE